MKKILSKIFIIICVIGLIAVTLSSSKVQAAIQSNPNTYYTKITTAINWMSYFRNMEKVGGALGLSETIDGTTMLATSESNNLDSHMIKSTEYGAIAILSASGYGNQKTLQNSTIKSTTREMAEIEYKEFKEKYKENKRLLKKVEEYIEHIYPLFEYPEEIRKIIYTTNPIESLNSALRKVTRGKGSFINEMALMKVLYLRIENLEKKWSKGSQNWRNVQNQLAILFEDRYTKYL